jgi:peptide alpha-N-acetyltransferase
VLQSTFLSTLDTSKSLKDVNEAYLQSHIKSAAHVHSVVRVRQALAKADDAGLKKVNVQSLLATVEGEEISLREVQEGRELLAVVGAEQDVKEAYLEKARKRWPDATVLLG